MSGRQGFTLILEESGTLEPKREFEIVLSVALLPGFPLTFPQAVSSCPLHVSMGIKRVRCSLGLKAHRPVRTRQQETEIVRAQCGQRGPGGGEGSVTCQRRDGVGVGGSFTKKEPQS